MIGRPIGAIVVVVAVSLVLACMGMVFPLEVAFYLLAGWIWYGIRVFPEVRVVWGSVVFGVICLAVFAGGTHAFSRWFYARWCESAEPVRIGACWPVRWTASLVAVAMLMFVAGVAAAGVGHQVGWLLSTRPLLVPDGGARSAARWAHSLNNLKQIGLAAHNYNAAFDAFPAGATATRDGELLHSWQTALLPELEQRDVYNQIDRSVPWDDPHNVSSFQVEIPTFLNPGIDQRRDSQGYALSHYAGNAHVLGGTRPLASAAISDGTSNTILAGEVASGYLPWGRPGNWRDPALGINRDPTGFGGPYRGGASILFTDGSVKFIKDSVDPSVLKALGTPAGGEGGPADPY